MRVHWLWLGLLTACGTDDDSYTVTALEKHGCGRLVVDGFHIERGTDVLRPGAAKGDADMTWDFWLDIRAWDGAPLVWRNHCEFVDGRTGAFFCGPSMDEGYDPSLRATIEGTVGDDGLELSYDSEWFSPHDEDWTEPACAFEAEAEPTRSTGAPIALGVTAT
jgi:hypothetical protein